MIDVSLCNCEECPLNAKVESTYFPGTYRRVGSGPVVPKRDTTHYDVVFVGISPAYEELKQKEFFVGKSGTLLRKTVKALGLDSCQYTNTMLCYFPTETTDSDIKTAIECCRPRLEQELKNYTPKLIVALGNIALRTLTDKDYGIQSVDGRVLRSDYGNVLALVHPAAVLRRADSFPDFVDSLRSGMRYLEGTYQQITLEPQVVVANDENIAEICQIMANADDLVIDLETTGKGFFPYGREPDQIRCLVASVDANAAFIVPGKCSPYYEPHPDYVDHPGLKDVLESKPAIYHNGQFDCGFLWQKGIKTKIKFDTFLAHYMIDERPYAHGLKHLAAKYLGAPDWEAEIKRYLPNKKSSYDLVPDDVLYWYAAYDTISTYQLHQIFKDDMMPLYYDLIMPATNMFVDLRHTGMKIDVGVMMEADELLEKDLEEAIKDLQDEVGFSINPSSPVEIAEYLYDTLGIPMHRKFGRSTSAMALKNLPENPILDKIIGIRELKKLQSTYVISLSNYIDYTWRIHPFLKLFATVTGRVAAENPSVLNVIQNQNIRKMYLPEDGHWLMDADQKQMELRWYVIINEDEHLKELLYSGDPHGIISDEIERVSGRHWDRKKVKTGVFGGIYMRGVDSYMTAFRISKQDATDFRKQIFNMVPTLEPYHNSIRDEMKTKGYLESYFGRKRRFGLLTKENFNEAWRQGVNFKIQSAASDTNLFCMLHLYNVGKKFGARPYWPVHDSVLLDLEDKDAVQDIRKEMERFSMELVDGAVEFTVETKIGRNWGEMKKICYACGRPVEKAAIKEVKGITHCPDCASKAGVH